MLAATAYNLVQPPKLGGAVAGPAQTPHKPAKPQ
jgi:hypothetical protein